MNQISVSAKSLFLYGAIALPVAFAGFPLYVLAPDFYATHYGLSLTLLGTLLLAIRLFDAVQDPFIGWLADRWRHKNFNFILGASLTLCMAIFGLFNIIFVNPVIWFALCLILATTAYSVLTIILGSYATLWTSDKNDQTRIASTREAFALIGLVVAVSTPAALTHIVAQEQVFIWYSAILLVLMTIGVICFVRLPIETSSQESSENFNLVCGLRAVAYDTKCFLLIYSLSMLASSIPAVLVIFYIRDLLQAEQIIGLFLLLYFLSGVIGIPLWKNLSFMLGKYRVWALSNILAVLGFIGAFFLGAGDVWTYGLVCVVSGLALGADLILPPSIIADKIHAAKKRSFSGVHFALLAFLSKASLAVASAVALPTLDVMGFKPQAANTSEALYVLSATYALLPSVLKLAATALLYILFIRPPKGDTHADSQNRSDHERSYHA